MKKIRKEFVDKVINNMKIISTLDLHYQQKFNEIDAYYKQIKGSSYKEYITLDELELINNEIINNKLHTNSALVYTVEYQNAKSLVNKVLDSFKNNNIDNISLEEKKLAERYLGLKGDAKYLYTKSNNKLDKVRFSNDDSPFELSDAEISMKREIDESINRDEIKNCEYFLPLQILKLCDFYIDCAIKETNKENPDIALTKSNFSLYTEIMKNNIDQLKKTIIDIDNIKISVYQNFDKLLEIEHLNEVIDLYEAISNDKNILKDILFEVIKDDCNQINDFNNLVEKNEEEDVLKFFDDAKKYYLYALGQSSPRKVDKKLVTSQLSDEAMLILRQSMNNDDKSKCELNKINSDGTINFEAYKK